MAVASQYWIYALGFVAQAFFGARLIIQWILSEREGRVVSPVIFWRLSLAASLMFLIYGVLQEDAVIVFGQTISYYIYIRNLQLKKDWQRYVDALKIFLLFLPAVALTLVASGMQIDWDRAIEKNDLSHPLLILGAIGQLMLNFRFLYQWYYSEKHHSSLLPLGFWVMSTVGSIAVIAYASFRIDPVLLVSQTMGLVPYVRNIFLHFKNK